MVSNCHVYRLLFKKRSVNCDTLAAKMIGKLLLLLNIYLVTQKTCKYKLYSYSILPIRMNFESIATLRACAYVVSVADDPIVQKAFPASATCRRTSQQRMYERSVAITQKLVNLYYNSYSIAYEYIKPYSYVYILLVKAIYNVTS